MAQTLPFLLLIAFLSTCARSAVGFGDALIAMPLLTILLGIQTATPLVGLMAAAMSGMILLQSWREVELGDAWRLVLASFVGMPAGIWLIRVAPEEWVSGGLGLLLIAFGLYALVRPVLPPLPNARWVYLFGGLAGALGAAYNTNGPPVVVYGALRRWSPVRFRATLQGFFLPSGFAISLSHAMGGLWNPQVFALFAFCLLPMIAAVAAGHWLNRRIPGERFSRLLYVIVSGLGLLLLVRSL